jgi:hypothetical protein
MENCKTKFVKKLTKEINTKAIRNTRKALKEIKTKLKKEPDNEELKKKKEFWERMLKVQKKGPDKQNVDFNVKTFCNPGCLETAFQEDVDFDKLMDFCKKKDGCNKKLIVAELKKTRKQLIRGSKHMLKDDFYHKFDPKTKARLIKQGALSGCVVGL